ncbi:MAG: hypothetical protein Fur0041_19330 [Bacteroidia bacterium]
MIHNTKDAASPYIAGKPDISATYAATEPLTINSVIANVGKAVIIKYIQHTILKRMNMSV